MPTVFAIQAGTSNAAHPRQSWQSAACAERFVCCSHLVPLLAASALPHARQGAVQMVDVLVKGLGTAVVPYLLLLVVPVMGRMSDPVAEVRQPATATFAPIVALLPLAQVTCPGAPSWHQSELCAAHVWLKSIRDIKYPCLHIWVQCAILLHIHALWQYLMRPAAVTSAPSQNLTANRLTVYHQQLLPHAT